MNRKGGAKTHLHEFRDTIDNAQYSGIEASNEYLGSLQAITQSPVLLNLESD